MAVQSVHWHEGMFLWPQQMQQAERFVSHQVHLSGKLSTFYNWGLRSFELDADALGNGRVAIRALRARLRDGTTVATPDDVALPAVDVKEALDRHGSLTVFLAVPNLRLGKANIGGRSAPAGAPALPEPAKQDLGDARYLVATQEIDDENTGADSQAIQVRQLNARLLLSTQDHAGYAILPLLRIRKSNRPDGKPEPDTDYIPPLLSCDAWKPLRDGVLQVLFDRFGRKVAKLSAQLITRGISFDTRNAGDAILLGQLHSLNEAYGYLRVLAFAEGTHPLDAYLELCRIAGQLAIFDRTNPRAPDLPRYDHDDLGGCFYRVKQYLDSIEITEPIYEERPFLGVESRMQVALERPWLDALWEMYVGVRSPLSAEECIRLFTLPGKINMKIGSAARVDEIYAGGRAGLKFTPSPTPPRALPSYPDLVYFQVSLQSQQAEWQSVEQSLTLAIRLNPDRIVGNIQGQRTLTIRTGGQTVTMSFTLYLTPRET